MVHKIHKTKKQDHLENHQVTRTVTRRLVTAPWTTEQPEYLHLQSSRRTQHARTESRGWSSSSRTRRLKIRLSRIWNRGRRSKNRKTWSPTWTTPRTFAKILPNSNVLTALPSGKCAWRMRVWPTSTWQVHTTIMTTITTMTTCTTQPQGLALWSQWVPARTPTVHWGRYDGRLWEGRPTPEMAKSRCNDASPRQHNTHVFRQTKWE